MMHRFFRRRKKIIKPRFQLKLAFFSVLFLFLITLIFGSAIFFPLAIELYSSEALEDQTRVAIVVLKLHEKIWLPLSAILILVFFGVILVSHRIAGPIYRLEKTIEEFMTGNFKERMKLRKTDELKEIEVIINNLATYLENSKFMDACFHENIKEGLLALHSTLQSEASLRAEKALNIVEELIKKLEYQPDAFTKLQN